MVRKILFVYNADSGPLAAMLDSARKLVQAESACALCSITHGLFSEKAVWGEIEKGLAIPMAYYHRDDMPTTVQEFVRQKSLALPLVLFERQDGSLHAAVTSKTLTDCDGNPGCLQDHLEAALQSSD